MKNKATVLSLGSLLAALIFVLIVFTPVYAAAPIVNNQTLSIPENSLPGATTTPQKIFVFDPEGEHNAGTLEFQKTGGDGQAIFDVGFNSGIVTLAAGQSLDFETKKSYTLNIQVQDTEVPPLSDTAVITINVTDVSDEPPVMGDQTFNVPENSPNNTLVGKIVFTDIDVNDSHTFTINSGNGTGAGAFQIAPNGNITVKDTTQLNFEVKNTFVMNVTIKDIGGLEDDATITINVTNVNEKPNVSDQQFSINENAANGTVVGTVVATDPDGDTLQFVRTSGSTAFAINSSSGQVTVANSSLLNFETNPAPTFVVTVNDGKGQNDTATITVNLNDVNDPPRVTGAGIPDVIVNEGTASANVNLWAAFEDDEDSDNQLTFAIQSNDNPGLFSSPPVPNNNTGALPLNFADGATGIANITVRAFDTQGAFVDDTFKVDFNEAPVAVGYSNITVQEDAPTSLVNLYSGFTDAEQASSTLIYEILSNTNGGLFSPPASIVLPNLVLDYAPDANGQTVITIRATDSAGLSAQTSFTVKVNAVNDPPTTSGISNVNVNEDAPDTVIKLDEAFDDKEDDPKQLQFEVVSNSNSNLLDATINQGAATLTLDYKPNAFGTATLTVKATDKGVPGVPNSSLSVQTTFTVNVAAVNDRPVVSPITKNIVEDIPYQFTLADFTSKFSDADGDSLVNVRIQTLPADGTLKLGNTNIIENQVIPANELSTLAFIPSFNWDEGSTSFMWNASDGTAYAEEPASATFTVQSENDPPIVSDIEMPASPEGVTVIFSLSNFSGAFTDVDGDSLTKIRIEQLPANGTLRLGNVNVTANQQINAANIANLRYVPNQFFNGQDSFVWSGNDGQVYSSPAQVILTITPKNDAPTLDLNGGGQGTGFSATFVAGKGPVVIAGQNLDITDIDNTMMAGATIIIVNRQHGSKEILDANVAGTNITKNFSAAAGVLSLSGTDTIENYEKVLKTVDYEIAADVTNPDTNTVRDVSFRVNDGELNSNDAISKVKVINPRIKVTVTPPIQTVAKDTTAVFTVLIENTGSVNLQNIQVMSATVPDCNRSFESLAAGQSLSAFACIVNNVQSRIDNEVIVTAIDAESGTQVTADDDAVVRVLQNVVIDIAPAPAMGDVLVRGQNAVFNVTVVNPSQADLTSVAVEATIDYDVVTGVRAPATPVPAPECNKTIGALNAGKESSYTCTIPNVQASFQLEVEVVGLIDGFVETRDFDIEEISVIDLTLEVFAVPFEIPSGEPTTVTFNMTLNNISNVELALNSLTSNRHGNLLNAANNAISNNTCSSLNLTIPEGEVRSCSYDVELTLSPPALTNIITAVVTGGDNKQLTVVDEALVSVADFSPMDLTVSANPPSLVAPGGAVNLTVQIKNNTSSDLTIDELTDSDPAIGNLNGKGNCEIPRTILGNGTYSCTYTVSISGKQPGDVVTHTITAVADAKEVERDVNIPITSAAQGRMLLPSVSVQAVAGEPNNSICSALPIGKEQNYYFYADDSDDWYRFVQDGSSSIKIVLSNYMGRGQIVVFNGNCSSPTFIQNNGNYESVKEVKLNLAAAGTYFIWVLTDSNFNSTSPYSLWIGPATP